MIQLIAPAPVFSASLFLLYYVVWENVSVVFKTSTGLQMDLYWSNFFFIFFLRINYVQLVN